MQFAENQTGELLDGGMPRWKRVLDLFCIALSLPFVLPLALVVAAWVLVVSGIPIIFRQERVGLRGRRFNCLKFRTMHVDADTSGHEAYLAQLARSDVPMIKLDQKGDSRLIFGARLLRATGMDELPQLLNVLRGEMSLVGPRPCLPYEYENYSAEQKSRLEATPGLTGLWQVNGKNKTTFNEMIHLDVTYARTQSLWLDVKIMAKTIPALIVQALETRNTGRRTVSSTVPQRVS